MATDLAHVNDGTCWCDQWGPTANLRTRALDRIYPDRCQLSAGLPVPSEVPETREPWCVLASGHDGPCCTRLERPGEGCHFCGRPNPTSGFCPFCYTSLDGMALADIKALFAAGDSQLSIDPRPAP